MSKKKLAVIGIAATCLILVYFALPRTDPHSGWRGQESLYWKGALYITCGGQYREGRTIGKTADGWDINEVEEDPSHTFLVARSFLDQYLFVREDYDIPASGTVTAVSLGRTQLTEGDLCRAVADLADQAGGTLTCKAEELDTSLYQYPLYIAYAGCPIATEFLGYLCAISGQWAIVTQVTFQPESTQPDAVHYSLIPAPSAQILASYLQ